MVIFERQYYPMFHGKHKEKNADYTLLFNECFMKSQKNPTNQLKNYGRRNTTFLSVNMWTVPELCCPLCSLCICYMCWARWGEKSCYYQTLTGTGCICNALNVCRNADISQSSQFPQADLRHRFIFLIVHYLQQFLYYFYFEHHSVYLAWLFFCSSLILIHFQFSN